MKSFLKLLVIAIVLFIAFLFINLLRFNSQQVHPPSIDEIAIPSGAIDRFSESLKIKTISTQESTTFDSMAFELFDSFISRSYPLTDSLLEHTIFLSHSHLFFWKGSDTSLKPIVLMGHIDVVPVIDSNKRDWKYGGFNGTVAEDTIWGRGTLDDKINVISVLESTERLLANGYTPKRGIYLSFGHDEEVGGTGAIAIANYLNERGVQAEFVLDEGSVITSGLIPGIQQDVALIGMAEKGFATIELSVDIEGGHSSMPSPETAIDVLSGAISRVKSNPFPGTVSAPLQKFFEFAGPEMPFPNNLVFANSFIFSGVIKKMYAKTNAGNAIIRTTTSPTIFNAGIKENIIPKRAKASINFRILPGETSTSVMKRVKNIINDERVELAFGSFISDPSPVSSIDNLGFLGLQTTINQIYPETIVAPNLVVAATDSRHFSKICKNIYRFSPLRLNSTNINSIHGINERVSVSEFENAIRFYHQLLVNTTGE